jgi:nucleoside-triphosphatase THEP1
LVIHAVLTGEVHTGKTTVCRGVVHLARQRGYCVRGILTPPILDAHGQRLGVAVVDLNSGEQRTLARCRSTVSGTAPDANWNGPRVGDYYFDAGALQWGQDVIVQAIATTYDLLVVDEIGRLELEQSTGFHQALDALGARTAQLIAGHSLLVVRKPLLPTFRLRTPNFKFVTFEVTVENRDTVAAEIIECLFPH